MRRLSAYRTALVEHGDRTDLAKPAARWMVKKLPDLPSETLVVPVPLHWLRFLKRRYNQAALLAKQIARETGLTLPRQQICRT